VYGYTNVGFVSVTSPLSGNLTDRLIGNLGTGLDIRLVRGTIVLSTRPDNEVLLCLGENGNGNSDVVYCYNVPQQGWTSLSGNGSTLSNISAMRSIVPPLRVTPGCCLG